MQKEARNLLILFAALISAGPVAANNAPTISAMPALSSSTLIANDATVYSVTMTATDADGYDDIHDMRVLFNVIDVAFDQTQGRGYIAWGATDADVTFYNDGAWITAGATGGGRWGYLSDRWGGTTYITPVSCATSTTGNAAGATGSRTVTWSFCVKPAWAANPLTNDADAYTRDSATSSAWKENPSEFDVVASTCASYAAVPLAPVVSAVTSTSASITIDAADSSIDLFAFRLSSGGDIKYVQANGTAGLSAVYRTKAQWATTTLKGLNSNTTYGLSARAFRNTAGYCPSAFGLATTISTAICERTINLAAVGRPISSLITGNSTRLDTFPDMLALWSKTWDILHNTMARGIAGGLDADTYNWRDMSGQGVGHGGTPGPNVPTTLAWMRLARDHQSTPLLTVNLRGIGPLASSGYCSFHYADTSIGTVAQLAADWVRYINFILPGYREGSTLATGDQLIVNAINWYGKPRLLTQGEASTPPVTYWEIGNEPELALPWCTAGATPFQPSPAEYTARYKQVTSAMLAVDSTIKVGPCITTAANGLNAYLSALLSDPAARVDFISYHPYGPLYGYAQTYGDTETSAEQGLQSIRKTQTDFRAGIRTVIAASGGDDNAMPLIASEWNSTDWHWEGSPPIRRVSHGLSVAETLWTFVDLGLLGATYWSWPAWAGDGTETPCYKVFETIQQHLGTTLIDALTDEPNLHVYSSRNAGDGGVSVWALNFSKDTDKPLRLDFASHVVLGLETLQLANVNGETHLFDTNDPPATAAPTIDWIPRPAPLPQGSGYLLTLPHSTATVIVVQHRPPAEADFDHDGDVDQEDFGHLQTCLTGPVTPQTDPACADAKLSNDLHVDGNDLTLFLRCMQGSDVPVLPGCSQ